MSRVSKEAVIEAISDELDRIDHVPQWVFERLEKRIKQLPSALGTNLAEVGKDCISRQQAIDALRTMQTYKLFAGDDMLLIDQAGAMTELMLLPSAQSERTLMQELLDVTADRDYWKAQCHSYEMTINRLTESAQPEIIRKPVIGYEGYYEVDNCGRVYALNRVIHVEDHGRSYDKPLIGGIIKQHMHSKGYKIVPLTRDGKTKNVFVHRIVAMAFLANPNKLPCVNHKDEDKTNNFAENLEWCTYQYNNAYGSKPKKHSKWMSGRKLSDEHKQHISDGHKRHWDKIRVERREVTE